MPITVNSPYSGRPVKVRDADIERAVRDEENRVFYVVKRPSGEGYYAALTRKGSAKDEARYDGMETKMDTTREVGAERSAAQVHDATGRRRPGTIRRAVILFVIVLLLAALAWFVLGRFAPGLLGPATPTPAVQPAAQLPHHLFLAGDAGNAGAGEPCFTHQRNHAVCRTTAPPLLPGAPRVPSEKHYAAKLAA